MRRVDDRASASGGVQAQPGAFRYRKIIAFGGKRTTVELFSLTSQKRSLAVGIGKLCWRESGDNRGQSRGTVQFEKKKRRNGPNSVRTPIAADRMGVTEQEKVMFEKARTRCPGLHAKISGFKEPARGRNAVC